MTTLELRLNDSDYHPTLVRECYQKTNYAVHIVQQHYIDGVWSTTTTTISVPENIAEVLSLFDEKTTVACNDDICQSQKDIPEKKTKLPL